VGIGEYEQQGIVTSDNIRSIIDGLLSFDLHEYVDSAIGNYWGLSRC
jgi:hypothetical protein